MRGCEENDRDLTRHNRYQSNGKLRRNRVIDVVMISRTGFVIIWRDILAPNRADQDNALHGWRRDLPVRFSTVLWGSAILAGLIVGSLLIA